MIEVAGSPREIGRQIGQRATERVHRTVAIYRRGFAEKGVEWSLARQVAARFAPRIERASPQIVEEMRGIAEGADLAFEDVVAINARTELLYGGFGDPEKADSEIDGCTGAIALPGATADGHLLHGQNWDWRDECAESSIVLRMHPDAGPAMLIFVEAGLMARAGLNNAGLAITGNYLECDQDGRREGLPIPVVRRQVLMQSGLGPAVEVVMRAERAFSINLMISHREGEAVDLETTPDEVFWLLPEDDLLVHANHFVSLPARIKVRDLSLPTNGDSLYRDVRVRRHLRDQHGAITVQTLQKAFQDRFGSPRAVCRAATAGPGGKVSSTVATIVMDTTARTMWVAPRPYGPHRFTEYRLD